MIVNLQATPKDKKAHLVIHGRADEVMGELMASLGMSIPAYVRQDQVVISTCQEAPSAEGYPITLNISSVHGESCPLPLIESVNVCFQANLWAIGPCWPVSSASSAVSDMRHACCSSSCWLQNGGAWKCALPHCGTLGRPGQP